MVSFVRISPAQYAYGIWDGFSRLPRTGMYLLVEDVWCHLEQLNNHIKTYIYQSVKYLNNNLTK